jgi:cation diffusion facilitator CzcD-associated flavoprotein CzcO
VNSPHLRFADSAAHENLHSNLPPEVMAFSQEPIPKQVSDYTRAQYGDESPFRHREDIRTWVEDVFSRGGLQSLVDFNTTVELAEKKDNEWLLTLRKSEQENGKNVWWQESFDAVIVASGHYHLPSLPNITGLAAYASRYPGRIQHTKHYLNTEAYRDKVRVDSQDTCSVADMDILTEIT